MKRLRVVVNAAGPGHVATCQACGWTSRPYPVPDTAYAKAKTHACERKT